MARVVAAAVVLPQTTYGWTTDTDGYAVLFKPVLCGDRPSNVVRQVALGWRHTNAGHGQRVARSSPHVPRVSPQPFYVTSVSSSAVAVATGPASAWVPPLHALLTPPLAVRRVSVRCDGVPAPVRRLVGTSVARSATVQADALRMGVACVAVRQMDAPVVLVRVVLYPFAKVGVTGVAYAVAGRNMVPDGRGKQVPLPHKP